MPEFSPAPPLMHRAARLVASAFVAVLFVLTAVPAAQASPNFETILRKTPTSEHTDADTLTWLLTFTEAVTNVDPTDFVVSGTTATLAVEPLAVDEEGCSQQWDATLSGGDLEGLSGTVTLTVSDQQDIWGCLGDGEAMTHPGPNETNHNTFVVDNTKPDDGDDPEPCSGGGYNPVPTEVTVTTVPIVVTSTTDDYFVLFVKHDIDGTEVELPVLVKLGEAGTTTLAENVEALPAERYRVEKYLIADPADVDGDCIDDLTELDDPMGLNPVNPAAAIEFSDGAVAVPDRATLQLLSPSGFFLKFILLGLDTAQPGVYFVNGHTHVRHSSFLNALDLDPGQAGLMSGGIIYDSKLVAPDGSQGAYYFWCRRKDLPFLLVARAHTVLTASVSLLEGNLGYHLINSALLSSQDDLPLYRASRLPLVFDADLFAETDFLALNPGEGYGRLRALEPDERPHPRDIVLYEALPNELPRVAGIISTVPQTPLSHVNLRAVQDDIPNAFIRDALDEPALAPLITPLLGSYVRYTVTAEGWDLRAATVEEVNAYYAASRPTATQTPQRDLSVRTITPLSELGFADWDAFGVKAANVAVLGTLGFPEGTVPDGFAIPFSFYDTFMTETALGQETVLGKGSAPAADKITLAAETKLGTAVTAMLAHPKFQTDFAIQDEMLAGGRDEAGHGRHGDAGPPEIPDGLRHPGRDAG